VNDFHQKIDSFQISSKLVRQGLHSYATEAEYNGITDIGTGTGKWKAASLTMMSQRYGTSVTTLTGQKPACHICKEAVSHTPTS
jgi:predicted RNA methylase